MKVVEFEKKGTTAIAQFFGDLKKIAEQDESLTSVMVVGYKEGPDGGVGISFVTGGKELSLVEIIGVLETVKYDVQRQYEE